MPTSPGHTLLGSDDHGLRPRVVAHLVHGTWPAGGFLAHTYPRFFKACPAWFDEGSEFRRAIEAEIPGIEWRVFKWCGDNSEVERRRAAWAFGDALGRGLDTAPDACHVVIAHSHGGNVALWALGSLDETKRDRVAGLATMGTPFLHFAQRKLSSIENWYLRSVLAGQLMFWFAICALPIVAVTSALERRGLGADDLFAFAIATAGLVAGSKGWRELRRRAAELEQRRPVGPERLASFVALRSRGDEASRVIAVADAVGRVFASAWPLVGLCCKIMPWDNPVWRWKVFRIALMVGAVLTAATLIPAGIDPGRIKPFVSAFFPAALAWPDWQQWLFFAVLIPVLNAFLLSVMIFAFACFPFAIALGIISYSQVFLGAAFGIDTYFLAIATEISAEPNPPHPAPVLQHVDPADVTTRHSLHAMPRDPHAPGPLGSSAPGRGRLGVLMVDDRAP